MATMVPSKAESRRSGGSRPNRRRRLRGVVLIAAATATSPAWAEKWFLEPGFDARVHWTSNSDFGHSGGSEDTVVEMRPRLVFRGEGARLRLQGSAHLNGLAYVNRTQDSRVLPDADVLANLELAERLFFVEAEYRAMPITEDPFGVRSEAASTVNTVTATQARLSPYIEGRAPNDIRYGLRSDNTWAREVGPAEGATTSDGYFGLHKVYVQKVPRPLGWRVEAERSYSSFDAVDRPSVGLSQARVFVDYAFSPEFMVAVTAGRESGDLLTGVDQRNIAGAQARWDPSPRTTIDLLREERFFGPSWAFAFNHRMPRLAWTVNLRRDLETTTQSLFELPAAANVSALLDSMYITRYPDPVERARVVQDLIASNGLSTATLGSTPLLADRVSIVTRHEASMVYTGVRHTLALSGYRVLTSDASETSSPATGTPEGNNLQFGASVELTHRLSQLLGLNVTLDWSRIRALASIGDDETTQRSLRIQFNLQAAPKTSAFFGGRLRQIQSNVVAQGKEGSVFVGLDHRF